ncbi:MAG: hypothetical protein WAK90_25765 [Pseudolabrys sp.]
MSDRYGSQAEVKPPKADINRRRAYVGFVPIADTGPLLNNLIGCGEELGWDGQPKRFSSGMPRGKASGTLWHRAEELEPALPLSNAGAGHCTRAEGEVQMPTKVNLELIIVWFCVGFFTGAGWAIATWLVGRILGLTHL